MLVYFTQLVIDSQWHQQGKGSVRDDGKNIFEKKLITLDINFILGNFSNYYEERPDPYLIPFDSCLTL